MKTCPTWRVFIERKKNDHAAGGLHGCRKRKNLLVLDDQDQYFFLRLQKPACSGVIIFDVAQAACYT